MGYICYQRRNKQKKWGDPGRDSPFMRHNINRFPLPVKHFIQIFIFDLEGDVMRR